MLKYIAGLSFARKIQLAVGLVTIGGAGAMLVIYVEAWTVRDRYRDLVASNAMTADAFDLAVSTAAYSQNTFEYIKKPIASQRARMVESARELAHRLRAIRDR